MARIMTLDGLQLGAVRARLDRADQPWWRRPAELSGIVSTLGAHALWIAAGLGALAGMAGAARSR